MKRTRKNLTHELAALQDRLRALLYANMEEARRTAELLRDAERKVEDHFGHIDSLETTWEIAARKFRKTPAPQPVQLLQKRPKSNLQQQTSNAPR